MEHDRADRLLSYPAEIFYYCYRTLEIFHQRLFGTVYAICIEGAKMTKAHVNIAVFIE